MTRLGSEVFCIMLILVFSNFVEGNSWACGTACHSQHETEYVTTSISQRVYGLARKTTFLPGFPDFETAVQELQKSQDLPNPTYEVCIPLADGSLVIKESLINLWTCKEELFQHEAGEVIADHNKRYNPSGVRRGGDNENERNDSGTSDVPHTRIQIDTVVKAADHESAIGDKFLSQVFLKLLTVMDS